MTICKNTVRTEKDHRIIEANELRGHTIELSFQHMQDQLIMTKPYRTFQTYFCYCSATLMWDLACSSLLRSSVYLYMLAREMSLYLVQLKLWKKVFLLVCWPGAMFPAD